MSDLGSMKTAIFSIGFLLSTLVNRKLQHASIISKNYFDDHNFRKNLLDTR